ncbi:hypothetical protein P052_00760 [Brucella melitensis 02-7258]|nr:hypothetical protein P052_00760 [Brucella melitensis 02-7258]
MVNMLSEQRDSLPGDTLQNRYRHIQGQVGSPSPPEGRNFPISHRAGTLIPASCAPSAFHAHRP